ncbi:MAG: DoxX family protein [Streptosporangiaceae bacterium]
MNTMAAPLASAVGDTGSRRRLAWYWLITVPVVAEMGVGGIWDIAQLSFVSTLVTHLGYPSYFLVLLGSWKVLGAAALLVPRRALLKEWVYAGAFFTYTGAMVSHLTTGYDRVEVPVLAVLAATTVLSWALRPARPPPGDGPGGAQHAGTRTGGRCTGAAVVRPPAGTA